MKTRFFVSLFSGLLLFSCGGKGRVPMNPQMPQDFTRYLTETGLMAQGPEKHLYVLLHPGYCGSCTEQVQKFVKTELENCAYDRTLIFSSDKEDITAKFETIPGLHVLKTEADSLHKYGLANGIELYGVFRAGQMLAFGPINVETIPGLRLCAD